ncbi:hypothetical protein [Deinococcus hopiensis]|nr:hypothetical protein [Deinococcus hopiensis]
MGEDKSTLGNMVDAAGAKLKEGADRLGAAGHEAVSDLTTGRTHVEHKAEAMEDRAKAEVHNLQADANYAEGKQEASDGDGH